MACTEKSAAQGALERGAAVNGAAMNVAAIDIGTNSVRLLIIDSNARELVRLMEITRLGQGVDETGALAEEAMSRTVSVLEVYGDSLREHGVTKARVTATSAARDAKNRGDFFARVKAATGHEPELLPGVEEARLSFLGATRSLSESQKPPFVVFDIGGGSTEFARGSKHPGAHLSIDMGSVRITERFLHSDPPSAEQLASARAFIHQELVRVRAVLQPDGSETWVGVAGTVTSFAARVVGNQHYDADLTHGVRLSAEFVRDFSNELCAATTEQRKLLLIEKKRAAVIHGGALILQAVMDEFALPFVVSSERDILDGLAESLTHSG